MTILKYPGFILRPKSGDPRRLRPAVEGIKSLPQDVPQHPRNSEFLVLVVERPVLHEVLEDGLDLREEQIVPQEDVDEVDEEEILLIRLYFFLELGDALGDLLPGLVDSLLELYFPPVERREALLLYITVELPNGVPGEFDELDVVGGAGGGEVLVGVGHFEKKNKKEKKIKLLVAAVAVALKRVVISN